MKGATEVIDQQRENERDNTRIFCYVAIVNTFYMSIYLKKTIPFHNVGFTFSEYV